MQLLTKDQRGSLTNITLVLTRYQPGYMRPPDRLIQCDMTDAVTCSGFIWLSVTCCSVTWPSWSLAPVSHGRVGHLLQCHMAESVTCSSITWPSRYIPLYPTNILADNKAFHLGKFTTILTREKTFVISHLLSCTSNPLLKGVYSKKKKIKGANSFLQETSPFQREVKQF